MIIIMTRMKQNKIKNKKNKSALMVLLINNTIMSLQDPLVRWITAEILHYVKNLCIIYMGNLFVAISFTASWKHLKIPLFHLFRNTGISSHILGPRKAILSVPLHIELTRGILKQVIRRKLQFGWFLGVKVFVKTLGVNPFVTLYISVARTSKFRLCI